MGDEVNVWSGRPSQVSNLWVFVWCALLSWLAVPIIYALLRWLKTHFTRYRLTTERLVIATGVLSRTTEQLELYRVRDYHLEEPFWMRIFGLGNVFVMSTDKSSKVVELHGIRDPAMVTDLFRKHAERMRHRKRRIV